MITQFGHYLLDEEIARGGMARVYRARLRGPGGFEKALVVKQVRPELARDPRFVEMFVQEAKTLVRMSHPHLVPVYELGVVEGVYFLAMEHVEGATLAEVLRDGPLAAAWAAHLGVQVCDALEYAHERFGLVHRDVTPRNVMIEPAGHVRLLDFGIAAPVEGAGPTGRVFGSPGYMSPEQVRGESLDARSDLFSLGVVLFEALTGERAFPRSEAGVDPGAAAPPWSDGPQIPDELRRLVDTLLAPDPASRPASAGAVARTLRGWLAATHPEGVASELGKRADAARAARGARAEPQEAPAEQAPPSTTGSSDVRTLATSPALSAALDRSTGRTAPMPGRARNRARRWATLGVLLALGVTGAAGVWAVLGPTGDRAGPEDGPSTSPGPPPSEPTVRAPDAEEDEGEPHAPQPAPNEPPRERDGPAPEPPDRTPTASQKARLTVNATPWAELTLGGRPLGTTPRRDVRIPAGEHTLELTCPPLGTRARVPVSAEPGQTIRVLADLTRDPPEVTVR